MHLWLGLRCVQGEYLYGVIRLFIHVQSLKLKPYEGGGLKMELGIRS